ncbi:MAG: glycosyltransferase family 39 protein [Bacteroidia bacterium]
MNWLKNNWLIVLILVIAFLLRFIPLFEYEFFFDELSALDRIRYTTFADLINKGIKVDVHPAFIQLFLFFWARVDGTSEAWIKLPFLVCGFLSCWFIFRFSNKWFGYKTGVISAIVVSCSMIFLVYSSSNHLYSTGVLFAILSLYYLFEIVFGKSVSLKHYILYGLFILLSALNHHMGALFGLITALLAFIFSDKKQRVYLVFTAIATVILYLPHLPITLAQMSYSIGAGDGGWLTAPKWYACFSFLKTLFGTGLVVYIFVLLFVYSGIQNKFSFLSDKKIIFLLITFVVYCLTIQLYSVLRSPILQFSVLLIAAPCIIIIVARSLSFIPDKLFTLVSIAFIIAFLVQTIYVKQYYSLGIKQGVHSSITQTIEAKNKYGAANVSAIYCTEAFFAKHYMDELKQNYSYLTAFDSTYNNPVLLSTYLNSLKENYIILSDPNVSLIERTKLYFPYLIYHDEGYFKSIFLFSKINTNCVKDETVIKTYTLHQPDEFIFPSNYKTENNAILIDSTDEFPFCVRANFSSLNLKGGQYVVATSSYKPYSTMGDLNFVFSIKEKDSTLFYASSNFKDSYLMGDTLQHGFSSLFIGTEINTWKNAKLECYFWNTGKKRYLVKDISLKIIDPNPHKYSLWD